MDGMDMVCALNLQRRIFQIRVSVRSELQELKSQPGRIDQEQTEQNSENLFLFQFSWVLDFFVLNMAKGRVIR